MLIHEYCVHTRPYLHWMIIPLRPQKIHQTPPPRTQTRRPSGHSPAFGGIQGFHMYAIMLYSQAPLWPASHTSFGGKLPDKRQTVYVTGVIFPGKPKYIGKTAYLFWKWAIVISIQSIRAIYSIQVNINTQTYGRLLECTVRLADCRFREYPVSMDVANYTVGT